MKEREKKAIVTAREYLTNPACNYLSSEEIETLLNIIDNQHKELLGLTHSLTFDYISKDKIREKIRNFKAVKQEIFRLENKLGNPSITYDIVRNDYCEKMLEDLLKENNYGRII